jgi:small subunit ribosomal protein S16
LSFDFEDFEERTKRAMVKIRLTRGGAKKRPHYRIIAIDERLQRDGRPLEYLGTYDPGSNPEKFNIKIDRFDAWIANGAQPSPTVRSLLKRARRRAAAAG